MVTNKLVNEERKVVTMNRFKKELRKHHVMLENDYQYLPYEVSNGIFLEGVTVNSENMCVTNHYNVISITNYYGKNFDIIKQE